LIVSLGAQQVGGEGLYRQHHVLVEEAIPQAHLQRRIEIIRNSWGSPIVFRHWNVSGQSR